MSGLDCLDALKEIDAEVAAITHPLGSLAYQKTTRVAPAGRDVLAYADADAPAPPLMDDEYNEAKQRSDEEALQRGNFLYQLTDEPAAASTGKKRKGRHGGVELPAWMDLDQETVSNAPVNPNRVFNSQGKNRRPVALDEFGGVGETTVQMRTARGPLGSDRAYDTLLGHHERAKERASKKANGVPPEGYVCHICQKPGHWISDCPAAVPKADKTKAPPADYVCNLCCGAGHWIEACPLARTAKAPRKAPLSAEQRVGAAEQRGAPAQGGASAPAKRRPGPGYVCNACGETGHYIADCPSRGAPAAGGAPPAGYVCHNCGQAGHYIRDCTAPSRGAAAAAVCRPVAVPELVVDAEHELVGAEIAEALDESAAEVLARMARVVAALGEEEARQALVQAWQVEEQGGLLTIDGSNRRRSPGGVFFWLIKQTATAEQRAQIWPPAPAAPAPAPGKAKKAKKPPKKAPAKTGPKLEDPASGPTSDPAMALGDDDDADDFEAELAKMLEAKSDELKKQGAAA